MTLERPLDPNEARVLGVLIEKGLTTPEQYPLSISALVAGANQKSNRDPVLALTDAQVVDTVERLRRTGLVAAHHPSGGRVERYSHNAATVLALAPPELAVLGELLLRGAQTPGDLRGRASRMSPLASLADLERVLDGLAARGLVHRLAPLPGTRATRWGELLAAHEAGAKTPREPVAHTPGASADARRPLPAAAPAPEPSAAAPSAPDPALPARVARLEGELVQLRTALATLAERLGEPLELGGGATG